MGSVLGQSGVGRTGGLAGGRGSAAARTNLSHTGSVNAVALGRVGDRDVIVSGGDAAVRIWDASTGQPIHELSHTGSVFAVALGRVGGRDAIIAGSSDGTVRIWDAEQLDAGPILDTLGPVKTVGVTRDERSVLQQHTPSVPSRSAHDGSDRHRQKTIDTEQLELVSEMDRSRSAHVCAS
jgi:WD40 repeat protein